MSYCFVSLFASTIHVDIRVMGIPVFSARCCGDRFARSAMVVTPASSSSIALFGPIPFICVKFELTAIFDPSLRILSISWSVLNVFEVYVKVGLVFLLDRYVPNPIIAAKKIPLNILFVRRPE